MGLLEEGFEMCSTPGSDLTLSVDPVELVPPPVPAPVVLVLAVPPGKPKDADRALVPPKGFWKS